MKLFDQEALPKGSVCFIPFESSQALELAENALFEAPPVRGGLGQVAIDEIIADGIQDAYEHAPAIPPDATLPLPIDIVLTTQESPLVERSLVLGGIGVWENVRQREGGVSSTQVFWGDPTPEDRNDLTRAFSTIEYF